MSYFEQLPFCKDKELSKFERIKKVCIPVYTGDTIYLYNLNEDEKNRVICQRSDHEEINEPSIEYLRNNPIAKVIYENVDVPYLMSFQDEIKDITENEVSVSYSSNRYMELNKLGGNKGGLYGIFRKTFRNKKEEKIAVVENYH